MMQNNDARKLPFADLWTQYCGFGDAMIATIADLALVNKSVVENMLAGKRVNRAEAVQVLTILSHHLGKWVSLNTIDVPVIAITDRVGQMVHPSCVVVG